MTSPRQIEANRRNGRQSKGPASAAGKQRSSRNATRHGVLSVEFLLADEDPAEFAALLQGLQNDYLPVGEYEHALVERMAVGLWRGRRLQCAERAEIELARHFDVVKTRLLKEYGYASNLSAADRLAILESERPVVDQALPLLAEIKRLLGQSEPLLFVSLAKDYPYLNNQLEQDATTAKMTLAEYIWVNPSGVATRIVPLAKQWQLTLIQLCELSLRKEDDQLATQLGMATQLIHARADLFIRYQSGIDHQVDRTFRQLKQVQALRGYTLNAV